MSRPKVRLIGYSRADRHKVISAISDAISASGGWLDDVNFFSNISVALRFVLPSSAGSEFLEALSAIDLRLGDTDQDQLRQLPQADEVESVCTINVTFAYDGPDLRQVILSVPG